MASKKIDHLYSFWRVVFDKVSFDTVSYAPFKAIQPEKSKYKKLVTIIHY
jgi:hypothetical protein